jgi:hypothetical protein
MNLYVMCESPAQLRDYLFLVSDVCFLRQQIMPLVKNSYRNFCLRISDGEYIFWLSF